MPVEVLVEDERWPSEDWGRYLAPLISGEVCLVLADDSTVQDLNHRFRGRNSPTNVLSFPAGDPRHPEVLGDVILAYETVAEEARTLGRPFHWHAAHLIVHGGLHLLGYTHENDEDAAVMEAREVAVLEEFSIPSPYAAPQVL